MEVGLDGPAITPQAVRKKKSSPLLWGSAGLSYMLAYYPSYREARMHEESTNHHVTNDHL